MSTFALLSHARFWVHTPLAELVRFVSAAPAKMNSHPICLQLEAYEGEGDASRPPHARKKPALQPEIWFLALSFRNLVEEER